MTDRAYGLRNAKCLFGTLFAVLCLLVCLLPSLFVFAEEEPAGDYDAHTLSGSVQADLEAWQERREALDRIYDMKEYRHLLNPNPIDLKKYISRFLNWLKDKLESLSPVMDKVPWETLQWVLFVLLVIAAAYIVVRLFRLFGTVGWRSGLSHAFPELKTDRPEEKIDWQTWRNQAEKDADGGRFREALRALFISVLLEGHERGWWSFEPENTNREFTRLLRLPRERKSALDALIDAYERAWYGYSKPDRETYSACLGWIRTIGETP